MENKKMKYMKNKKLCSIFAVLMILSFVASVIAVPNANAQLTERTSWPIIDAIPKTAGVGQLVLINYGLLNQLNDVADGWNVTLQVFYPNGDVKNYTSMTWSTGQVGRRLSFTEVGDYVVRCVFDGEEYTHVVASNGRDMNGYYKPAISENLTITIGENWKANYPGSYLGSLPNEYWTRPVNSQTREWWAILGSWVTRPLNAYAPYNDAPESAHVLWNTPIGDTPAGLSGGDNMMAGFQNGDAYEGKFVGSVIVAGVLYFNRYVANSPTQTVVAVDIRTGKTLWEKDFNFGSPAANRVNRGQILTYVNENNRGAWAYIWFVSGTTWYAVNPVQGNLVYTMTNVPAGNVYIGPNGEMLKYAVTNSGGTNYRLTQWNSTYVVNNQRAQEPVPPRESWGSEIQGLTFDAGTYGYDRNVSLPHITSSIGNLLVAFPEDRVIFGNVSNTGVTLTGFNIDQENFGASLFTRKTWKAPTEWQDRSVDVVMYAQQSGWMTYSQEDYVAIFWAKENRKNYAFSLETGNYLWETITQNALDGYTDSPSAEKLIAYNKLYSAGVGGTVYCYDIKNGALLWTYNATDKYNESYHSENWWLVPTFISCGKIYIGHMTHSNQVPISRGAPFFALDAETGDLVWEIDGAFRQTRWGGRAMLADSVIVTMDMYDQNIWGVGKGPAALTVSTPDIAVTAGTTALIRGTVTDISPATESDAIKFRFPDGVPAVSDESMSEFMLYVYKDFARPTDTTGLKITVFAQNEVDQTFEIGTTTSDAMGKYSITWTPPKEGNYKIYAYFDSTASFYGTTATNSLAVSSAPEIAETEPYGLYIALAAIAIIIVVVIFGLLILLKKK